MNRGKIYNKIARFKGEQIKAIYNIGERNITRLLSFIPHISTLIPVLLRFPVRSRTTLYVLCLFPNDLLQRVLSLREIKRIKLPVHKSCGHIHIRTLPIV